MKPNDAHPQERTARELLTQNRPLFVGTADEVAVYWDSYERAFAAIDVDGNADTVELSETPFATPGEYCGHIAKRHGWDVGPRIGGSLVGDLRRAVEATQ